IAVALSVWRLPSWATGAAVAAGLLAVLAVPGYLRSPVPSSHPPAEFAGPALARATNLGAYSDLAEYRPIEIPAEKIHSLPSAPQVAGDGDVLSWNQGRQVMTADVAMREPGTVVFPVLFYDFYRVSVGSRPVKAF